MVDSEILMVIEVAQLGRKIAMCPGERNFPPFIFKYLLHAFKCSMLKLMHKSSKVVCSAVLGMT
jgi:hypothetical protein